MKIVLYMAMTLNGYIAKENGETPWSEDVWNSYYSIAKKYKAIILGRKTYEIMEEAKEFEKIGNPLVIVISKNKNKSKKDLHFVNNAKTAVNILKEKGFEEALLGGGGKVNASLIKENLIDEIILDIEPVIFGKGIKLFADEDFETRLELLDIKKIPKNSIQLHYRVNLQRLETISKGKFIKIGNMGDFKKS